MTGDDIREKARSAAEHPYVVAAARLMTVVGVPMAGLLAAFLIDAVRSNTAAVHGFGRELSAVTQRVEEHHRRLDGHDRWVERVGELLVVPRGGERP